VQKDQEIEYDQMSVLLCYMGDNLDLMQT